MKCPFCRGESLKVIDSRSSCDANAIRRRRECLSCQKRFTTFETFELSVQVHKRDGRYEEFQQQKLVKGIEAACRHTEISKDRVLALAARITSDIMEQQIRQVSSRELGEKVMSYLKQMDAVAYIRFACVYKKFKDLEELMEAIKSTNAVAEDRKPATEEMICH